MAQEVKVLDTRKLPATTRERLGKFDRVVTWQVADGGTFISVLPDETFSESSLKEAIRKELEQRGQLVGKSLQV
jgi:hypothetical protein